MLAVILKILSIIGIILLIILGILVCILLLVLFLPIVYRIDAQRFEEHLKADVKVRWLFGLLRVGYSYPEPGKVKAKLLWFTLFDAEKSKSSDNPKKGNYIGRTACPRCSPVKSDDSVPESSTEDQDSVSETSQEQNTSMPKAEADSEQSAKSFSDKLFAKCEKMKYTFKQIYDKIKHIFKNLSFYKKLLQDEETKLLFSHVCNRLGKVLHQLFRPRKLKADVVFGTGSPDTTGYAYGIYGMFSPHLGQDVCITPDFTQQILEGRIYAAGHITVIHLLLNLLAVLLDKKLRIFIRRMKAHSEKNNSVPKKAAVNG